MHVVRKEEKEARLAEFLGDSFKALDADTSSHPVVSIVARGYDSPVVAALASQSALLSHAGILVRLLVVNEEASVPTAFADISRTLKVRVGSDHRIHDAHEQLVFGDRVVWIGDCMRRDPAKRDAYECYSRDCAETAIFALRSFERLWKLGRPAKAHAFDSLKARNVEIIEVALAAISETEPAATASTRH
ncbi:MAG: hypothetical protein NW216_11660 [Hyphomicrobium sp.]|nr:hypothetical protein [Hyphomicrobium sp.]